MYGLTQITPPDLEPVDLEQAKRQCRTVAPEEEPDVEDMIVAAREEAENRTDRQLITATWQLTLDRFPPGRCPIRFPRGRLQSIESLEYTAGDGTTGTLVVDTHFKLHTAQEPGFIVPVYGAVWPIARWELSAVRITFTCGYGDDADSVPFSIKRWMLLQVGNQYAHRELDQPMAISRLSTFEQGLLLPYLLGDEFIPYDGYDPEKRAEF